MSKSPTVTSRWWIPLAAVALAALVMGLPTLGGSFVGGDDHRLALNHVLVNHPSFSHAVELFTIWHRDLYQPLALLSFQLEFALAQQLGLFDRGLEGGQWLFHLTNILLHVINTVLVWQLIVRLQTNIHRAQAVADGASTMGDAPWDEEWSRSAIAIATMTALLFAIHPFQTEVVAWTNGRMMLLSTCFGLLSLLSFHSWLDHSRKRSAVFCVLWAVFSGLSKVRVGLPILLAIVALTRYRKVNKKSLAVWIPATVVTAILAYVNIMATADAQLFAEGAEYLRGPRAVRVIMALAFYAQHLVWPVGLASYYPTPPVVSWSDPQLIRSLLILVPTLLIATWACWRSRVARLGMIWFFATIGATLPLFPARNVLAADRYMYLPIIGVLWILATGANRAYERWISSFGPAVRRVIVTVVCLLVVIPSLGMCRHVAWFYSTPLRKTQRIASLFPTTPRVWEREGWTHYGLGQYEKALECARKEMAHSSPKVLSGAYQLIGMCTLKLGDSERALDILRQAVKLDPENVLAKYRLGMALDDLGRTEKAVHYYELAVKDAPLSNPTLHRLANAYRKLGRKDDARRTLEQTLSNNPNYEVAAILGLSELDIEENTPESYQRAEKRLLALLEWMPENSAAWADLGIVRKELGKPALAVDAYQTALRLDPTNVYAAFNLAWLYALRGDTMSARTMIDEYRGTADLPPLALATYAVADLVDGLCQSANQRVIELCQPDTALENGRHRVLQALESYGQRHPDSPWTYTIAARLLLANGQTDAAKAAIPLADTRCHASDCRQEIEAIRAMLSNGL